MSFRPGGRLGGYPAGFSSGGPFLPCPSCSAPRLLILNRRVSHHTAGSTARKILLRIISTKLAACGRIGSWMVLGEMTTLRSLLAPKQACMALTFLALTSLATASYAWQHEEHEPGMDQTILAPQTPVADLAKEEADKRFSEFNHRFAGVFVFLVGVVALLQPYLARRFGVIRYLWTVLFLIPGVYLLVFSDPESWPIGNQTLYYVVTENMQVLQHKIFSLILLALSTVEYFRVRGKLRAMWTAFLFPAFAGAGAALLFFHSPQAHAAAMDPSTHQAMMEIRNQHVQFGLVGFGIAISKAVADTERFHPRWMQVIFAALMLILGMLLITYTE